MNKKLYVILLVLVYFLTCIDRVYSKETDSLEIAAYIEYYKANFKEATRLYSELIAKDEKNIEYIYRRGECYYNLSDYNRAIDDFNIVENEKKGMASFYLTKIYTIKKNYKEAFKYIERHLESKYKLPESSIKNDEIIKRLEKKEKWNEIWQYNWYSRRDELYREISYLTNYSRFEDALDIINNEIDKGSKNHKLYALKGKVYMDMEQHKLAEEAYTIAIKSTKRKYPDFYKGRAEAYFKLGNYTKSLSDYEAILEIEPYKVYHYKKMAQIAFEAENYNDANEYMDKYIKYFPDDEEALYQFGNIYYNKGNYFNALRYYNKIIKPGAGKYSYYLARGKAYLQTNTYKFAENDFSMALDLNPKIAEVYLERGIARIKQNNYDGACSDWLKSKELGNLQAIVYLDNYCKIP